MRIKRPKGGRTVLFRDNVKLLRRLKAESPSIVAIEQLRYMTNTFGFSLSLGDCLYLNGGWYVTHSGLLRLAQRRRCFGISVQQIRGFCDPSSRRWVFKAILRKGRGAHAFVGYGDADPSNVSPLVHGAEMRVAETRAVNRALRKAYGIGLCSVEELGWEPMPRGSSGPQRLTSPAVNNGHQNGHTRLRDRLCLLIRQHQLDANLVKAYAADFCGTPNLRDASREQIESFIANLRESAMRDRSSLVCKLNSYSKPQEVTS
jgi:hypothetical protein